MIPSTESARSISSRVIPIKNKTESKYGGRYRGVGHGPGGGLGVEGDSQAGCLEHVDVIGSIADGNSSMSGDSKADREFLEHLAFAGPIDDISDHPSCQAPVLPTSRVFARISVTPSSLARGDTTCPKPPETNAIR